MSIIKMPNEEVDAIFNLPLECDKLRQQVTLLHDTLKQARHMIYYDEAQIGWSITRIDEVLDATKEN